MPGVRRDGDGARARAASPRMKTIARRLASTRVSASRTVEADPRSHRERRHGDEDAQRGRDHGRADRRKPRRVGPTIQQRRRLGRRARLTILASSARVSPSSRQRVSASARQRVIASARERVIRVVRAQLVARGRRLGGLAEHAKRVGLEREFLRPELPRGAPAPSAPWSARPQRHRVRAHRAPPRPASLRASGGRRPRRPRRASSRAA